MTTINPVVTTQAQALAFRGGQKKSVEILEKLVKDIPDEALMQTALKDIRKPVSDEAYVAAHNKAGEFLGALNKGGQKKSEEILGKLVKDTPDEVLMQTALKDIRKPVSDEAYVTAHKKAGEFIKLQELNEALAKGAAKDIYKK